MILSKELTNNIDMLHKALLKYKASPTLEAKASFTKALESLDKMMSEEILSSTQYKHEWKEFALILTNLESACNPDEKVAFCKLEEIFRFLRQNGLLGIIETIEFYASFLSSTLPERQASTALGLASSRRSPESVEAFGAAEAQACVKVPENRAAVKRNYGRLETQVASSSSFFNSAKADEHEEDNRGHLFHEGLSF